MTVWICNGINSDETYPARKKLVKSCFQDVDIDVSFGSQREFTFYRREVKHRSTRESERKITGTVLAFISVNHVNGECRVPGSLWFYPIKKSLLSAKAQREFEEDYLTRMREWYLNELRSDSILDEYKDLIVFLDGDKLDAVEVR